jgi:hypothetical protein
MYVYFLEIIACTLKTFWIQKWFSIKYCKFSNSILQQSASLLLTVREGGKHTDIFDDNNNSVALVRERTIPTERPPLVGEVSANLCG